MENERILSNEELVEVTGGEVFIPKDPHHIIHPHPITKYGIPFRPKKDHDRLYILTPYKQGNRVGGSQLF